MVSPKEAGELADMEENRFLIKMKSNLLSKLVKYQETRDQRLEKEIQEILDTLKANKFSISREETAFKKLKKSFKN